MVKKQVRGTVRAKDSILVKNGSENLILKRILPIVEEGTYRASIIEVKSILAVKTRLGETPRIGCTFKLENGLELKQNFLMIFGDNHPAYQMIMTVFGSIEDADIQALSGQTVVVEVEHKKVGANTYANITRIFSREELEELSDEEDEMTEEEFEV